MPQPFDSLFHFKNNIFWPINYFVFISCVFTNIKIFFFSCGCHTGLFLVELHSCGHTETIVNYIIFRYVFKDIVGPLSRIYLGATICPSTELDTKRHRKMQKRSTTPQAYTQIASWTITIIFTTFITIKFMLMSLHVSSNFKSVDPCRQLFTRHGILTI